MLLSAHIFSLGYKLLGMVQLHPKYFENGVSWPGAWGNWALLKFPRILSCKGLRKNRIKFQALTMQNWLGKRVLDRRCPVFQTSMNFMETEEKHSNIADKYYQESFSKPLISASLIAHRFLVHNTYLYRIIFLLIIVESIIS